ncbi:MAG: IclR family transcriptional regulator [Rhodospirillum sp.]|nr:IclR family transcriptional regulator [Rhodospirillum sp.]MCF8491072.1 IclR family transcriptional regulator [Rhodospirillum sp.]MCF8500216.1 IclR family transcriptional regulator [Rhodospirillum sp.]
MSEKRVEAVERALSILEAFTEDRRAMSLAELAGETGLYKSTILRLIASLDRYGYMKRMEDGRYRLGPSLWRLGSLYHKDFDPGESIRPVLRDLVELTGETASFYVCEQGERLCLYRENSHNPLRHHLEEGSRLSMTYGASARILRAYGLGEAESQQALLANGCYISVGERNRDIAAVAAPLFDRENRFRGALAVSGLKTRFDQTFRDRALDLVIAAAKRLQSKL